MSVAPMVHRMATWGGLWAPFVLSLLSLAGQTPPGNRYKYRYRYSVPVPVTVPSSLIMSSRGVNRINSEDETHGAPLLHGRTGVGRLGTLLDTAEELNPALGVVALQ